MARSMGEGMSRKPGFEANCPVLNSYCGGNQEQFWPTVYNAIALGFTDCAGKGVPAGENQASGMPKPRVSTFASMAVSSFAAPGCWPHH